VKTARVTCSFIIMGVILLANRSKPLVYMHLSGIRVSFYSHPA